MRRTVVGAALLALAALVVWQVGVRRGTPEPTQVGLPFYPAAHAQEPFAEELFGVLARAGHDPDDELFTVNSDVRSEYLNVEDGIRRTTEGPKDAPVVWFVGGSTMFGMGQRDGHTIPSEVVRLAADDNLPVQAVNFGVSAHIAWQETLTIKRALDTLPRPDLIVVYHGLNDLSILCRQLAVGDAPGGRVNPEATKPVGDDPEVDCYVDPERSGRQLAGIIEPQIEEARRAAGDIPLVEFWQPYAATRAPKAVDDDLFAHIGTKREYLDGQLAVYRSALGQRTQPVIDLTDAYDDVDGPIFYDVAHTNERGALIAAQAMWERSLRAEVEAL